MVGAHFRWAPRWGRSAVPIRKAAPSVLSVASRLSLLIRGRSLREDIRLKIRASTIFSRVSSLAELGIVYC